MLKIRGCGHSRIACRLVEPGKFLKMATTLIYCIGDCIINLRLNYAALKVN